MHLGFIRISEQAAIIFIYRSKWSFL